MDFQGVEWVRSIKGKSKVLEYPEDNHTLSMISTEAHDFIATHSWFTQHSVPKAPDASDLKIMKTPEPAKIKLKLYKHKLADM